jgi:hypothetical protein
MKMHSLSVKEFGKAAGIGMLTAVLLSAIMVTALKTGISPMPKPLALAFAQTLLHTELPLPAGLLFHAAWVTLWSVIYVVLFRDRLTFARALGLALALWITVLAVFYPLVGWGPLGLAVSPKLIISALVSHLLFALFLWGLAHWAFEGPHKSEARRYSVGP